MFFSNKYLSMMKLLKVIKCVLQAIDTNPVIESSVQRRVRLGWSAFEEQGNLILGSQPFCSQEVFSQCVFINWPSLWKAMRGGESGMKRSVLEITIMDKSKLQMDRSSKREWHIEDNAMQADGNDINVEERTVGGQNERVYVLHFSRRDKCWIVKMLKRLHGTSRADLALDLQIGKWGDWYNNPQIMTPQRAPGNWG